MKIRIENYIQLGKSNGRQDPTIWKGGDPQLMHYLVTGEGADRITAPRDTKFPPLSLAEIALLETLDCADLIQILNEV